MTRTTNIPGVTTADTAVGKTTARRFSAAILLGFVILHGTSGPAFSKEIAPCATAGSLAEAGGSRALVASQPDKLIIAIRPDQPRVGRPVITWLVGQQPGHLLVARQISWKFNNPASMLKGGNGGSSSTIYLTPGVKKISVAVTDMAGKRRKATCTFNVTW